jgi:hypothetical protein
MAKHFVLGYLDGIRWEGFVRQFNIEKHELPRFFVLDYTKQTFYEDDEVDEVDEIEQYLADIVAEKVGSTARHISIYLLYTLDDDSSIEVRTRF